jgi:phosphoesterase RecJ-like protein
MYTDTGGFSYNSNDPDVFNIIAELLRKGIDKDRIVRNINNNFTAERFRLIGYVLFEKLQVFPELHSSIYSLTADELRRFKYLKGDMEGVVNMPLQIRGHKLSISLREDLEHPIIWVSIRSYDNVSARDMAEQFFGGGGHFNAAGGRLDNISMEEAVERAKAAIEAFRNELTKDDSPNVEESSN